MFLFYYGKYEKLFSFALMFEKFFLNKQKMRKEKLEVFDFQAFKIPSWNISTFYPFGRKSHFPKYKEVLQSCFF